MLEKVKKAEKYFYKNQLSGYLRQRENVIKDYEGTPALFFFLSWVVLSHVLFHFIMHWKLDYKLYSPNNAIPFFLYPFTSLFLLQNLSLFTFVLFVKLEAPTHNIGKYIFT